MSDEAQEPTESVNDASPGASASSPSKSDAPGETTSASSSESEASLAGEADEPVLDEEQDRSSDRIDSVVYGLVWLIVFVGIPIYIVLRLTVL